MVETVIAQSINTSILILEEEVDSRVASTVCPSASFQTSLFQTEFIYPSIIGSGANGPVGHEGYRRIIAVPSGGNDPAVPYQI